MKNVLTAALLMIAIHFFANQAIADIYKWVDQNGVIHFSDSPPTSGQNVETKKTTNYPKREGKRNYTNKVEIYTTSWCRYCKKAIAFLQSNRIKFKQYDIEKDSKAAAMMKALGGTGGVPSAIINGKQVYGFSTKKYKQALGLP